MNKTFWSYLIKKKKENNNQIHHEKETQVYTL